MTDVNHESMERSGRLIRDEGEQLSAAVALPLATLNELGPYFGDPASDEAAQIFRKGQDGHPGYDDTVEDVRKAVKNMDEAYKSIGKAIVAMSENVRAADWASMVDNASVKAIIESGERADQPISVPTTQAERA